MAGKPFSTNYKIVTEDGWIFINGDQIVRMEFKKGETENAMTLYMSDGSSFPLNHESAEKLRKAVDEVAGQ